MMRAVVVAWLGLALACGAPPAGGLDGGADAGDLSLDAGHFIPEPDGGSGDDAGGGDDAGSPDAGEPDAGQPDAGLADAGQPDAGLADAGRDDAGLAEDAGAPDAGALETGAPWDGGFTNGCKSPTYSLPPFRVRAMAANLTSGNFQSYDPGHGQRIIQGVQPDVVMIQEFNSGDKSAAAIAGFVEATFPDAGYSWHRGAAGATNGIPNGVISRWPIVASGEWVDTRVSNRGFTWARVDLPGPHELWVVSVHLLTASASVRNAQAQDLVALFTANIPSTDYLLLGGDFNTDTRAEACYSTFSSYVVTAGPHPVDQNGVEGTNSARSKPYDGVYASTCLRRQQVATVIGASQYDAGLVVDTTVYTPLTEIAPAQYDDSIAPSMQHMGVVKDFLVQP
jgi:endonuclease/exonuclease/phosphatase family metal-dependent hydrolase